MALSRPDCADRVPCAAPPTWRRAPIIPWASS